MADVIRQAVLHEGFSMVEIMTQCPTYFGRKNKQGSAVDMMRWFKDHTAQTGSEKLEKDPSLIARGIIVEKEMPEYCQEYDKIIERAQGIKQ
jgi:2-oxoglutarate/2-oxoacid ferredoxin oxidoreductase subunit beta